VQIKYQPDGLDRLVGSPYPTLKSIFNQPAAALHDTSPVDTELFETLVYPKPLVLHSPGKSSLWIDPALSSP